MKINHGRTTIENANHAFQLNRTLKKFNNCPFNEKYTKDTVPQIAMIVSPLARNPRAT